MRKRLGVALAAALVVTACGTAPQGTDIALDTGGASGPGTTVTTTTTTTTGAATPRPVAASGLAVTPVALAASRADRGDREVTIPSGTPLHLSLNTAIASDTSRVEDAVSADLTSAVIVGRRVVLPAGATVSGIVTEADDSGRVKGRARMEIDFTSVTTGGHRYLLSAVPVSHLAPATKGEDATKIGIGAGAGAVIGGILGGKKGAAQGAAVGGGAGTGVVLATSGREVRLASGTDVSTRLTAPLTVRVAD